MIKDQSGFMPLVTVFLIVITLAAGTLVVKNLPINQPQPDPSKGFQASGSAILNSASPTINPSPKTSPIVKSSASIPPSNATNISPTTHTNSTSSQNQQNNNSNSNSNTNTQNNSQPTPSPETTSPTPSPTPQLKSYSYTGNNINATLYCTSSSSFKISGTIEVISNSSSDGFWGAISEGGNTNLFVYNMGNPPKLTLGYTILDPVSPLRGGTPIRLVGDQRSYILSVYKAPYTTGNPNLSEKVGEVVVAIDCAK